MPLRELPWTCLVALALSGGCGAATVSAESPVGEDPPQVEQPDLATDEGATETEVPAPTAELATPAPAETPSETPTPPVAAAPDQAGIKHVHADLDPANDGVIGPPDPIDDCEERLAAAGIQFKPARIGVGRKVDGAYTCGAHQVVRVAKGPGKIKYSSRPLLTCGMAIALADFERIVQEEAERTLGTRVKKIDHMGTYNCREMANYDMVSEHSFANGIDLRRFHLADGRTITVLEHFQPKLAEPEDPRTIFLRSLSNRLFDEGVFSVVVTPYFDRIHRNHIHVDLARYRVDGSRE